MGGAVPAVVIWISRTHERVEVSPFGMQASFEENQRVLDSQVALRTRSSLVVSVVEVPGCAAFGGLLIGLIAKLLVVTVTVETPGTPLTVNNVAVVAVPPGEMVAI